MASPWRFPLPRGRHIVRLSYQTPGRTTGWILSVIDVALLGALLMGKEGLIKKEQG